MDYSLFDLQKLKAHTKIKNSWFLELQYADDCALLSHTPEGLQEIISTVADLYSKFGLKINIRKTPPAAVTVIMINNTPLHVADSFKYLGTWLSNDCKLDTEIRNRICKASRSFGKMQARVFEKHNLTLKTISKVYSCMPLHSALWE